MQENGHFGRFLRNFKAVKGLNRVLRTSGGGELEIVQKVKDLVFWPLSAEMKHIYPYPHAIF